MFFLLAFSIILLNTYTDVEAAGTAVSLPSVTVTYKDSGQDIANGNTYISDSLEYYSKGGSYFSDFYYSSDNFDDWSAGDGFGDGTFYDATSFENVFFYSGKRITLFTSEPEYYGYRLTLTLKNKRKLEFASTHRKPYWVLGTASDLADGLNVSGYVDADKFTCWIPTNYSVQALHMAPLFCFYAFSMYSSDFDDHAYRYGSYNIDCDYTVQCVGYKDVNTYNSALNDMKTELETQTGELKEQTEELENANKELDKQTELMEEQNKEQKGFFGSVLDFFGGFFDNLVNSVIGLFVPSADEMSAIFDKFNAFFEQKFGFLYYPFSVLAKVINAFLNNSSESIQFTFPGFSIMGLTVWEGQRFWFGGQSTALSIFKYVRMGTGVIIVFAFINYLRNYFDKRFGGGG